MAIYFSWKDHDNNSKDSFTIKLFSQISPRWYPTNIIGSTVQATFDMYSDQMGSGSVEIAKVFNDLFISTVRTGALTGRSYSKMYDNFGVLYNLDKLYEQSFGTFNSSSVLMGYRNEIRLATDAYFNGTTLEGIKRLGQAFSGMSPYVDEQVKHYLGWKLSTFTGSILETGSNFYVINVNIPNVGNVVPKDLVVASGSTFTFSLSRLGINTKIYSGFHFYSGVDTTIYGSGSTPLFSSQIENSLQAVVRADQAIYPSYSERYAYWRPSSNFIFSITPPDNIINYNDYIYNVGTPLDVIVSGSVIQLPSNASNFDWQYDWIVRKFNDAEYDMLSRSYPSASIPNTVYFTQINSKEQISYLPNTLGENSFGDLIPYLVSSSSLPFSFYVYVSPGVYVPFIVSGSEGTYGKTSHYIINRNSTLSDVSGHGYNLDRVVSFGSSSIYNRGRHQNQIVPFKLNSSNMYFSGSTGGWQNFRESFYFEFWARGIDNTFGNSYLQFKRQDTTTNLYDRGTITDNGWCAYIDNSYFSFNIKSGSTTGSVVFPITDYLGEEPSRWHYFAGTFSSGSVYLFIDGKTVQTDLVPLLSLSNTINGYSSFVSSGSCTTGVDELLVSSGFLAPEESYRHFNLSKPRFGENTIFASGAIELFHQPCIIIKASGTAEIEWHEFSIRARESTIYTARDLPFSRHFF